MIPKIDGTSITSKNIISIERKINPGSIPPVKLKINGAIHFRTVSFVANTTEHTKADEGVIK